MSEARRLLERMIEAQAKSGKKIDESLLESMYGPNESHYFDEPGIDLAIAVDNWDIPRCAYVLDKNNDAIAKIKIPTSTSNSISILEGNLNESDYKKTIVILNSKRGGVPCWESIWYCLEPRSTFLA